MLVDYTTPGVSTFALAGDWLYRFGAQPPCLLRETALFDALHGELAIVLGETRDDEIDAVLSSTSDLSACPPTLYYEDTRTNRWVGIQYGGSSVCSWIRTLL